MSNVAWRSFKDQHGLSLDQLSESQPVLLVFLRHFGCTFCIEAIDDLAKLRGQIEEKGVKIAFVHMSDSKKADEHFEAKNLSGVSHFSDAKKELYKIFGLKRGNPLQLLGPKSILRGIEAGLLNKHGIGRLQGDGFQMPGVFLIHKGVIKNSFIHRSASDRPDYLSLAEAG